nr:putative ribonuclease H-like domain-containing protein [Tanacetum cinerariifolium]
VQEDQGYVDSGYSRYMTENMSYLLDFKEFNGGYVTFRGGVNGGKITSKGTIQTETKDETLGILKKFITEIENLVDKKVKVIKSDNGIEFKNSVLNYFCAIKGIKREFGVARTPQENGVTKRRNRTLIEVARTMLVDFELPTTFWTEAVNLACYVQNRMKVILLDILCIVRLLRCGPKWLFDINMLIESMNYMPVIAGTNSNDFVGTEEHISQGHSSNKTGSSQDYILMPLWKDGLLFDSSSKNPTIDEPQSFYDAENKMIMVLTKTVELLLMKIFTASIEANHADFFGDQ